MPYILLFIGITGYYQCAIVGAALFALQIFAMVLE